VHVPELHQLVVHPHGVQSLIVLVGILQSKRRMSMKKIFLPKKKSQESFEHTMKYGRWFLNSSLTSPTCTVIADPGHSAR
jgi:hypothetical protein